MQRGAPLILGHPGNHVETPIGILPFAAALLARRHYPPDNNALLDALRPRCRLTAITWTILLLRNCESRNVWQMMPDELIFEILRRIPNDYSMQFYVESASNIPWAGREGFLAPRTFHIIDQRFLV